MHTTLKLLTCLFAFSAVAACGSDSDDDANNNGASASSDLPPGLVIEQFAVDATQVQASAPPSAGKTEITQPPGLLGYYEGSVPTRLVVFAHGLNHNVVDHWTQYIIRTTRPDVATVTSDYRDNLQFPILRGAHDLIAATLHAKQRFPTIETVYLLGVSMGGAVSGTAIAESVHVTDDATGLYDYWIALEPLVNLYEAYFEAALVLPEIAADMEEDAGGDPLTQPQAYQRRSPVTRSMEMADSGIRAVAIVHPLNDGLVSYNQGREMALATSLVGIPTQLTTVLRTAEGQDAGTDGTGLIADTLGVDDPNDQIRLAGHADEADAAHPVMRRGFEILEELLDGTYDETIPYMEHVLDDG
ncbi:MAG: hypothetical protein R3352_07120 [Salinisphaeraceae bacterium]|nr:hypothetical protein [Salinisphaeraceae bacterium]